MRLLDGINDVRTITQLLGGAEAEARSAGERLPGPEHLLLAAAALPDGSAARALGRVGVDTQQLRTAVQQAHASALAAVGIGVEPGLDGAADLRAPATGAFQATPAAQQAFQEAVALSKSVRPSRLTGAHVVAAVCQLERGTAARALAVLGVDRDSLRDAARDEAGLG